MKRLRASRESVFLVLFIGLACSTPPATNKDQVDAHSPSPLFTPDENQHPPVDGGKDITTLTSNECWEICDWVAQAKEQASTPDSCNDMDLCLWICAGLNEPSFNAPTVVTVSEFGECMLPSRARCDCELHNFINHPDCLRFTQRLGITPTLPETTPLLQATYVAPFLCNPIQPPNPAVVDGLTLQYETCVLNLQSLPCRCTGEPSAQELIECRMTLNDLLLNLGGEASDYEDYSSTFFENRSTVNQDRYLTSLTCLESRQVCGSLIRGARWDPNCYGDYESFSLEHCNVMISSLIARCTISDAPAECGTRVSDLANCRVEDASPTCPACTGWNPDCLVPSSEESGFAVETSIADLSEEILRSWCIWSTNMSGGANYVPADCNHNFEVSRVPNVETCVTDIKDILGPCGIALSSLESYRLDSIYSDPCHRVQIFRPCAENKNKEACHLLSGSLRQCMEEVWQVNQEAWRQ